MRFLTARLGFWPRALPLALLISLLGALPARAGSDPAPAPSTPAPALAPSATALPGMEQVLILNDWQYTARGGSSTSGGSASARNFLADLLVFMQFVNLTLAGRTVGNGPGQVSSRIFGVLFLEFAYDLSVMGKLSTSELNALVFGEYFLNQLFVIPSLTGTTG